MTWNVINSEEIETGQPVSNETATKIKGNFDNLESRVTSLEGSGNTIYPALTYRISGAYGESGDLIIPASGILKDTINFGITVTGVRILIDEAGISGTTEIDIRFKRGGGAYTSIFSTRPSVSYSAGNDSISSNGVLNPTYVNLQAGDIIRIDISDAQKRAVGMTIRLDYTKT